MTSKIEKFTSKGIKTANGEEVEADVVILATGFDVEQSFKAYKVFGRFGKVLHDEWGDAPFAYKGTIMVSKKMTQIFRVIMNYNHVAAKFS